MKLFLFQFMIKLNKFEVLMQKYIWNRFSIMGGYLMPNAMTVTKNLLHAGQPNILVQYNLKKGNAGEAIRKSAFVAKNAYKIGFR